MKVINTLFTAAFLVGSSMNVDGVKFSGEPKEDACELDACTSYWAGDTSPPDGHLENLRITEDRVIANTPQECFAECAAHAEKQRWKMDRVRAGFINWAPAGELEIGCYVMYLPEDLTYKYFESPDKGTCNVNWPAMGQQVGENYLEGASGIAWYKLTDTNIRNCIGEDDSSRNDGSLETATTENIKTGDGNDQVFNVMESQGETCELDACTSYWAGDTSPPDSHLVNLKITEDRVTANTPQECFARCAAHAENEKWSMDRVRAGFINWAPAGELEIGCYVMYLPEDLSYKYFESPDKGTCNVNWPAMGQQVGENYLEGASGMAWYKLTDANIRNCTGEDDSSPNNGSLEMMTSTKKETRNAAAAARQRTDRTGQVINVKEDKEEMSFYCDMHIGFFEGLGKEPSVDDIRSLVDRTEEWMSEASGIAVEIDKEITESYDSANDPDGFSLEFSSIFKVYNHETSVNLKTALEFVKNADYVAYIKNFIWEAPPFMVNQFYQTQQVRLGCYPGKRPTGGAGERRLRGGAAASPAVSYGGQVAMDVSARPTEI